MSSKPEELSSKGDGFGTVIEELVPERTVEDVAAQVPTIYEVAVAAADSSLSVAGMQYLIDSVHAFTGLNWWASIVLTTFLVRGLTIPMFKSQLKLALELCLLLPRLAEMIKIGIELQTDDPKALAEYEKQAAALIKVCLARLSSRWVEMFLDGFIYVSFFLAIRNMAQKVPSFKGGGTLWFTDLTTPDSLYILPVLVGLILWFTTEPFLQRNLVARNRRPISWVLATVAVQATFGFESVVYCFMLPSRLFTLALSRVIGRSPKIRKLFNLRDVFESPASASQSGFSSFSAGKNNTSVPGKLSLFSELSKIIDRIMSLEERLNDIKRKKK